MERTNLLGENTLIIDELTQGKQLATQLKGLLECCKTSPERCEALLEKLLSSYDKAMTLLNLKLFFGGADVALHGNNPNVLSPSSDASDGDSSKEQCYKHVSKKRKASPQWSEQVHLCSGNLDDGHGWRKYGQKDILGAKFPRAYYRCTHRNTQGCLATKQVQRSDENPSVFEVTYKGRHSCKASHPSMISGDNECPDSQFLQQKSLENKQHVHGLVFNYGLNNQKFDDKLGAEQDAVPSFTFVPVPVKSENAEKERKLFECSFPPPFGSPTTSDSIYFSFLADQNEGFFGLDQIMDKSESDLTDHIISTPTSVMISPFIDNSDMPADDQVNLATDISEYFS